MRERTDSVVIISVMIPLSQPFLPANVRVTPWWRRAARPDRPTLPRPRLCCYALGVRTTPPHRAPGLSCCFSSRSFSPWRVLGPVNLAVEKLTSLAQRKSCKLQSGSFPHRLRSGAWEVLCLCRLRYAAGSFIMPWIDCRMKWRALK